jgi:hypothetical protein
MVRCRQQINVIEEFAAAALSDAGRYPQQLIR